MGGEERRAFFLSMFLPVGLATRRRGGAEEGVLFRPL